MGLLVAQSPKIRRHWCLLKLGTSLALMTYWWFWRFVYTVTWLSVLPSENLSVKLLIASISCAPTQLCLIVLTAHHACVAHRAAMSDSDDQILS